MEHLFIIDSFYLLVPGHDSTLTLMRSALRRGHSVWGAELKDIRFVSTEVQVVAQPVNIDEKGLVLGKAKKSFFLDRMDSPIVWIRKDPPVDKQYTRACQLLRLAKSPVINNPNSLVSCDEKLFALEFLEFIPHTVIAQDMDYIKGLVRQESPLVAKPIGGKGGEGVLVLNENDKNLRSLIETLTASGRKKIVLQSYLPGARIGDKRIFLLAGEPIGAVLRVPVKDDYRANMAVGASIAKTRVTEREREICEKIKPRLLELGLYIVGLDMIDEKLTEINITSPTGLEEIARLDGSDPADRIIKWSENYRFPESGEIYK